MRAMIRLHTLGYPFGFFKNTDFPHQFLVDQDAGDGADRNTKTPWQDVQESVEKHPGQYDNGDREYGFSEPPVLRAVSPLPQGADNDWYDAPYRTLDIRFQSSPVLQLITSKDQREIEYSKGMMASPAIGSLLFKLKDFDVNGRKGGVNNDEDYNEMLRECEKNRVVVCGSGVGGTGSSVAPTLSSILKEKGARVMALMVHRWFRFDSDGKNYPEADARDQVMKKNAASGLASYGKDLADEVATVLVGVPNAGLVRREYTSDNQQPCQDSYAHVIAALAAMRYFFSGEGKKNGLYGVSASDNSRLTGGINIIGRGSNSSLRLNGLADHAASLANTLQEFSKALEKSSNHFSNRNSDHLFDWFNFGLRAGPPAPAIYNWTCRQLRDTTFGVEDVAKHLDDISRIYNELLEWLHQLGLKKDYRTDTSNFTSHRKCNNRIRKKEPALDSISKTGKTTEPQRIAYAIFHWVADWIRDSWEDKYEPDPRGQGYWPDANPSADSVSDSKTGLRPSWGEPGSLAITNHGDIDEVLKDFYDLDDVSPNSWPCPVAVAEEFRFKVTNEDPVALRKLEMLLVGQAMGKLELKKINHFSEEVDEGPSLEKLIEEEYPGMVQYGIVYKKREDRKIFGFNSPETLLCPAPDVSDEDWKLLWEDITGDFKADWRQSQKWGVVGGEAKSCVATWLKRVSPYLKKNAPKLMGWVDLLAKKWKEEGSSSIPFGIGEWIPLPGGEKEIPLPSKEDSLPVPESYTASENPIIEGNDLGKKMDRAFDKIQSPDSGVDYTLIRNFHISGENHISVIWKEHLDELQKQDRFFAWTRADKEDSIWVIKKLEDESINPTQVINLRVVDKDKISIGSRCIPLKQHPVPGSNNTPNIKFPDLPLLPEYIGLIRVPKGEKHEGEESVKHNWKGVESGVMENQSSGKGILWKLHLLGRSDLVQIRCLYKETAEAHWMIWPNFKVKGGSGNKPKPWKAYYLYEHSTLESLEARPIFLDDDGIPSEPQERPPGILGHSRAISFDSRKGCHTGGPPVALCAYAKNQCVGIYTIKLKDYERDGDEWKLAVDFGTSHTVAAEDEGDDGNVKLAEEPASSREKGLTLHISENWPPKPEMELGVWRPNYVENVDQNFKAQLPSDLWSFRDLGSIETAEIEENWEPMTHYAIPVVKLQRSDADTHVISGFKWVINDKKFEGKESWFQVRYLGMAIEIFVAEMVQKRNRLPKKIQLAFTYPLRSGTSGGDKERYKNSIKEMLEHSQNDLGYEADFSDERLISESHTARKTIGRGGSFEVKLVADLGGGTLDTSISISSVRDDNEFNEIADSVKLGGDELLKILAENAEKYLPNHEGWRNRGYRSCYDNLRAWMRSEGSEKLFSSENTRWEARELELKGFENRRGGNQARLLIDRYFWLITDFLARSLVAYVATQVWPELKGKSHRTKLNLRVQLLGNGWRLWYGSSDYQDIQTEMRDRVKERTIQLWNDQKEMGQWVNEYAELDVTGTQDVNSSKENLWPEPKGVTDPKLLPICKAVGMSKETTKKFYQFPLSKVLLLRDTKDDIEKKWFERLPFDNVDDPDNIKIEIQKFDPPLCMHSPNNSQEPVAEIEDKLMMSINDGISVKEVPNANQLNAPIAALIWENMFKSDEFRKP